MRKYFEFYEKNTKVQSIIKFLCFRHVGFVGKLTEDSLHFFAENI